MTVCGEKVTGVCVAGKCPHFKRCCPVVWDKYGIIKPKTNEEWRKTCSTEEFAEWISNLAYACMRCGMSNGEAYCHTGYCIQDEEDVLMWLKQPHKPIS